MGIVMIAAVSDGRFADLDAAAKHCVDFSASFIPNPQESLERKYRRFTALYEAAKKISAIE